MKNSIHELAQAQEAKKAAEKETIDLMKEGLEIQKKLNKLKEESHHLNEEQISGGSVIKSDGKFNSKRMLGDTETRKNTEVDSMKEVVSIEDTFSTSLKELAAAHDGTVGDAAREVAESSASIEVNTALIPASLNNLASALAGSTPTNPTPDPRPGYATGGLVTGQSGIDKVPAMLTAGEFVVPKKEVDEFKKIRKYVKGGRVQELAEGGRIQNLVSGSLNLGASILGSEAAARSNGNKKKDTPPEFDYNKLKSQDLGFDVSLNANDPRVSGRMADSHPGIKDYEKHLLELHEYKVGKKNEKFAKRMGVFDKIMGMVTSYVVSGLTAGAAKGVAVLKGKTDDFVMGKMGGFGMAKHSEAYNQAKADGYNVSYDDFRKGAVTGQVKMVKDGKVQYHNYDKDTRSVTGIDAAKTKRYQAWNEQQKEFKSKNKKADFFGDIFSQLPGVPGKQSATKKAKGFNSGGSVVPAMLTAGESFIPSDIAKKIGYSNLEKLNTTGDIPTVQGPQGIDKVGPVGLSEGDFIIKKSSSDKLMRNNPNLFKMATQNPDGFRKSINNYYNGGVVSDSNRIPSATQSGNRASPSVAPQQDQFAPLPEPGPVRGSDSGSSSVTNNINVNVTIDESGKSTESSSGGDGSGKMSEQRDLSTKIKAAVLDVIRQEKRVGGELS